MESGATGIRSAPPSPGGSLILSSNDIPTLIEELKQKKFYGLLSLQFREGEVVLIERKETILIDKAKTHGGTSVHRDNHR
jgi:hypothetical protein